jgi:hypothetical protein
VNTLLIGQTWIEVRLWITPKLKTLRRTRVMLRHYHYP